MPRSCESCTKCCEGFLVATIRGHKMGDVINGDNHNPVPCPFVQKNVGCKEYKLRPVDPCRKFKCEWLINENIPESFKPNLSNTIVTKQRTKSGEEYLLLTDAGSDLDQNVLDWFLMYSKHNNINFGWRKNGISRFAGSKQFLDIIDKENKRTEQAQ